MKRKTNRKNTGPLVTSIASVVKDAQDTRPFTADEIRAEKREVHRILKDSLHLYAEKLKRGDVDMSSSLDLERVVKMLMLVLGEPEGVPQGEEKQTVITFAEPLSLDDADVKSVYQKLTQEYNRHNDEGTAERK